MIYIIHFNTKLAHAQHYIGSAADVRARYRAHLNGHGSRIMSAVVNKGISTRCFVIAEGGKVDERKLKNRKNSSRLCPVCRRRIGVSKEVKL